MISKPHDGAIRLLMNRITKSYIKVLFAAIVIGLLFWIIDGIFEYMFFHKNLSFLVLEGPETLMESLVLQVPPHSLFVRTSFLIACFISGCIVAVFLARRLKAEESLRESEAMFKTLIRTIPDLVWLKDPDGRYIACNTRFEKFFGAKEEEIIGKTDRDFLGEELAAFFRHYDQLAIEKGSPSVNEEEITFADDGHKELLETIKTPMYRDDGHFVGVLGIGRNITERVQMQAQISQAQKMESLGRLAGGIAHDYNNVSSVIVGYSELGLEGLNPADPLYDYLQEIHKAAQRAANFTRQLLAFARRQTAAPVVIDLNDAIEKMLTMLQRLIGEHITLSWRPGTEIWPLKIDPSQIDQILANLCINARDAIADTGRIAISTENTACDVNTCAENTDLVPGDYVALTVSDDGQGIDPETLDKIFDPFFTTKEVGKGSGLGLSTVYGIVKQYNGFICVDSELKQGTSIRIYLPRCVEKEPLAKNRNEAPADLPLGRGERILFVEDDEPILELGEKILTGLGYEVMSSPSPLQALELAKSRGKEIDLLVTDVIMPQMNGRELAETLQGMFPSLKVLFISGYTADVIAQKGVVEEGVHFLPKPFTKADLAAKVREALD